MAQWGYFFLANRVAWDPLRAPLGPEWGTGIRSYPSRTPCKFARGCGPKYCWEPKRPKSDTTPPAWPTQVTKTVTYERIPTPKRGLLVGLSSTLAARVVKKKFVVLAMR